MRKGAYRLAAGLTGALVIVLCVLVFGSPQDKNEGNGFTLYTPSPGETPGAGQGGQQGWGNWAGQSGEPTPSPVATIVPTYAATPAPSPSPAPTSAALRNGSQGAAVETVQQRLKTLGYLTGSVDGTFGNGTEKAVREFQSINGLTVDGVVGARTMEKLMSSSAKPKPAAKSDTSKATAMPRPKTYTASTPSASYGYLAPGNSGGSVTKLQNRLISLGYLSGKATGKYDDATEEAVRAFQERNGQWVDGKAGPDTQSMLYSDKALAAPK